MAKPQLTMQHYACIELLPIFAYTVPSRYRKLAFAAIAVPVLYVVFFMKIAGTAPFTHLLDIGIGMRIAAILVYAFNDLILHDAQADYRRIGDKTDISTRPFLSRLWWSFQVNINPRGVGWTQEVSGLPPKPAETSRYRFIGFLVLDLLKLFIIWDINGLIMRMNPYYTREQRVEGFERLWRLTYSPGYAINLMIQAMMEQRMAAVLCLVLGFTRPDEWRPVHGSLTEAYTLARFWGTCWHAVFRKGLVGPAKAVNRSLGLREKSFWGGLVGLTIVFGISALMHLVSEYALMDDLKAATGPFYFFLLQVPALIFEQGVIALARRLKLRLPSWLNYAIGYTWLLLWCAAVLPLWVDPQVRLGYWGDAPKYSIFLWMWKGQMEWFEHDR